MDQGRVTSSDLTRGCRKNPPRRGSVWGSIVGTTPLHSVISRQGQYSINGCYESKSDADSRIFPFLSPHGHPASTYTHLSHASREDATTRICFLRGGENLSTNPFEDPTGNLSRCSESGESEMKYSQSPSTDDNLLERSYIPSPCL